MNDYLIPLIIGVLSKCLIFYIKARNLNQIQTHNEVEEYFDCIEEEKIQAEESNILVCHPSVVENLKVNKIKQQIWKEPESAESAYKAYNEHVKQETENHAKSFADQEARKPALQQGWKGVETLKNIDPICVERENKREQYERLKLSSDHREAQKLRGKKLRGQHKKISGNFSKVRIMRP